MSDPTQEELEAVVALMWWLDCEDNDAQPDPNSDASCDDSLLNSNTDSAESANNLED